MCIASYRTQHQHGKAVLEFERLGEHPEGSDLKVSQASMSSAP
ncbi:MAG TPA: bacteriocin immunity protein [Pseudomonas sp.]